MRRLSKKEWIAVAIGLVVIVIFFNKSFFSFLTSKMGSPQMNNQEQQKQVPPEAKPTAIVAAVDLVTGTGEEVKKGSIVTVNYIGTFANGTKFDSSYDSGNPLEFEVGTRQLIAGFDAGVVGMKVGGKRQITIPPEFAYGAQGRPPIIPPNSTLIFTVEVVSVK